MIALDRACDDYLALRRALGFKLVRHGRLLPDLVAYLDAGGATTVTIRLALEWATEPAGHPQEWAVRPSIARGSRANCRRLTAVPRCPRGPAAPLPTAADAVPVLRR